MTSNLSHAGRGWESRVRVLPFELRNNVKENEAKQSSTFLWLYNFETSIEWVYAIGTAFLWPGAANQNKCGCFNSTASSSRRSSNNFQQHWILQLD